MAKMFKDQDGSIQEVVESRLVTRDWIENEIKETQIRLDSLNEMLNDYKVLSGEVPANDPATAPAPAPTQPQPEVIVADVVVVEQPPQTVAAPDVPLEPQPQQPTPVPAPAPEQAAPAPQIIPVQA